MKNLLVMGGVGVGLFGATVVGLLGVQGRLNYEGTRGVPILSMFFSAPPVEETDGETDGHGAQSEAGAGHAAAEDAHGDGHDAPGAMPHGETVGGVDSGVRLDGIGKESRLEYSIGKSALRPEASGGGGHGGGHGGDSGADDNHGGGHATDSAHGSEESHDVRKKLTPPANDFEHQMDSLLGQSQYRRGDFFKFPRLEGDITVDQLNQYLQTARQSLDRLDKERVAIEGYQAELDARQRDIEDRERTVADQMAEVDRARAKLDGRIREFRTQVLAVRRDELPALQQYAETLSSFEAGRAMEHVVQQWDRSEQSRSRILKVLAVMEPEKVNALLAEIDLPKLEEVLVQRLRIVIEEKRR